jgi:hypothetical protein
MDHNFFSFLINHFKLNHFKHPKFYPIKFILNDKSQLLSLHFFSQTLQNLINHLILFRFSIVS